ncbi:MAG: TonB-dependent receptor [Candidatus Orphnella occulta]|nr:TonB-dependent receptor [Candidatus Orphnella occulta]
MRKTLAIFFVVMLLSGEAFSAQEKTIELEPIVVTPWRAEESATDISRNVSVITQEDIENSSAQSLPELIQDKSGVVVSDYFGNPKNAIVDIRGFGESSASNVLVLMDGRRTNQVDLSGTDWAQIDLNVVERVEIVRGPSTTLYGDNATGGVINIITKKGTTQKPKIKLAGELGSYQYRKGYINLSGIHTISGNSIEDEDSKLIYLDYFLSYSNQDSTGYRANNDYWANDYFGKFDFYLSDMFQLNISSGYHRDHYGMPGALYWNGNPNTPTSRGINQLGRRGTDFPNDRGSTSDCFVTVEPKYSFFVTSNPVDLSAFFSFRQRRSKGLNITEPDIWFTPYAEYETIHNITTYEFRPKLQTSLEWKGINNKLLVGADYFHAKDDVLSGDRIGSQQDEADIYKETISIYVHDNIKINDKILFNSGFRGEWADYTFKQKRLIVNHDTKKLKEAAFNFGVGYKYNDKSQVYVDISRSYRFPNTEEYYQNKYLNTWVSPPEVQGGLNSDLKHQHAINYEIGIKGVSLDCLQFNIDGFLMDVKSEIYFDPDPATYKNSNYSPKTRHYGLEAEARLNLLDGKINPFFNWTLQESFFKGGIYAGNQVPFVPKSKISTGITISPIKGLDWTTGLNYIGSRFKISDQNNIAPKLKDYTIFDTKLAYTHKYGNIWGAVKNVFDKKYYAYGVTNSTGSAETFYPAPERRFEAGMSITF